MYTSVHLLQSNFVPDRFHTDQEQNQIVGRQKAFPSSLSCREALVMFGYLSNDFGNLRLETPSILQM